MEDVLLVAHVATAILFIGPVSVATAMFPRLASSGDTSAASTMHRMCRTYGALSLLVPALGIVLAIQDDLLDTAWVGTSILLSAIAAAVLWLVVRDQGRTLASGGATPRRLPIAAGAFSAIWVAVLVLMVVRPG